jgi:hypothetical protein
MRSIGKGAKTNFAAQQRRRNPAPTTTKTENPAMRRVFVSSIHPLDVRFVPKADIGLVDS